VFFLDARSRLNFFLLFMEVQSARNQHLLDLPDKHHVYADDGQGDVAPHQIPEAMDPEWVILQFLEPEVNQRLGLKPVDPIRIAAVWLLTKPPFVLIEWERHCRGEVRRKIDAYLASRDFTKGAMSCQVVVGGAEFRRCIVGITSGRRVKMGSLG